MKIAILGYGTVGSGVADIIELNNKTVSENVGEDIEVKYILDIREFPGDKNEKKITNDYNKILEDDEVRVVCEVMGGVNPAYEFSKKALEAGKSVCTSNKELVANHGGELLELARKNKVNYLFEASCGGGIPVICTINSALTANNIDEITGILNGTTNYILTNMAEKGAEYAEVLKEAQDLGYAERNPEADVEGYDACRKIAILSSLAFNKKVSYEDIYTEGITKISKEDILYAKRMNMAIRLLATSRKAEDGRVFSMVSPFMVNSS
ncbi:MAG: homoserine dehydrogenase, partial [Lachnospiraceae bacterium]|nr:homoserine dehydrogenase [Lachnospiraceae bacterium]